MLQNHFKTFRFFLFLSSVAPALSYGKDGCRGSTSRHVDPSNCHNYFQCIAGVRYRARCEPGMAFTKVTQKCEISIRTPCSANKVTGHSMVGKRCKLNNEIRPSELECDKYLLCRVKKYIALSCPFGLIFSNVKYRCVRPPNPCITVAEHAASTNKTLKEVELKKEENPYIGICDNKINKTVPEPFDCAFYILCEEELGDDGSVQAAMSVLECPKGTLFGVTENKCVEPKSVFCDQRYRIVNLYGPDVPPPSLGRSIGRSVSSNNTNPARPKIWVQPGKYRAISRSRLGNDTRNLNKTNSTAKNAGNREVLTTVINGVIIQKPLVEETPTPKDDANRTASAEIGRSARFRVNSTTTRKPDGRSFNTEAETEAPTDVGIETLEPEALIPTLENLNPVPTPEDTNRTPSSDIYVGTTSVSPTNTNTNTVHKSLITNNINTVNGSNNQPIVVNIILDELHRVRGATTSQNRITVAVKGSSETHVMPEVPDYYSLESDENQPFKFTKNSPRGQKRRTFLEDYHATRNGQRFNSTSDDILYYGEDEYYIADSSENNTGTFPRPNRLESSLELTHHVLRIGSLPKQKLPKKD